MSRYEALQRIATQVAEGELSFPTSVAVAMKIRSALEDPECHIDTAVRLVQAEPLLSARVVAMANSVAYNRSGREIGDVRTAVTRIGFATLRSLAMALVARQMAGAPASAVQQRIAAQLWAHTAHVAALARVLARRVSGQDAETALFAGLVHEVGSFYLLSRSGEYPELLHAETVAQSIVPEDDDPFDEPASVIEHALTLAVLRRLGVPEGVVHAVQGLAAGYLAMPPRSLADTLLLATQLCPLPSPLHPAEARAADGALELLVGADTLTAILDESAAELASLAQALSF